MHPHPSEDVGVKDLFEDRPSDNLNAETLKSILDARIPDRPFGEVTTLV